MQCPSYHNFLHKKILYLHALQENREMAARYLDPKYSRWISVDPALGEYMPAAGKGNVKDTGSLPGMGGIYNSVNGSLYHYASNNPVRYIDPDGKQSSFLPGGGTQFNGPCPGMRYDINEYTALNNAIANLVQGITAKSEDIICTIQIIIDGISGGKYANAAQKFYIKVLWDFDCIKIEAKYSGRFDRNNDGFYSKDECKLFSEYVNNTMLLNYSDQSELGPYKIVIPQITEKEANFF